MRFCHAAIVFSIITSYHINKNSSLSNCNCLSVTVHLSPLFNIGRALNEDHV